MYRIKFLLSFFLIISLFSLSSAQCPAIICPPNVTVNTDSGGCTAIVNYTPPIGTDTCNFGSVTFNYTGNLQTFTVPNGITSINIEARGASGGNVSTTCSATGGLGARMKGDFSVTPGQELSVMVGQMGITNGEDAGGGGGSFVVATGNVPLLVAGGGGGASNNIRSCGSNLNGLDASITTSGTASANGQVLGGTPNNGGGCNGGSAGGGGGFLTDGTGTTNVAGNGKSYVNGGAGGIGYNANHGGYGGGGCGWHTGGNGGGGGGYAGGGTSSAQPYTGGGGGGSYNSGTNQVNTSGFQTGNGAVIFTYVSGTTTTSLFSGQPSGSSYSLGTHTNTYHVTNGLGDSATCSFTITVADSILPTLICPSDISVNSTSSSCTAIANFSTPVGTDNCSGNVTTVLAAGLPGGSAFPVGVTTETFVTTDASGNTTACSFQVTIISTLSASQSLTICDGATITVGTHTYSTAGVYVDTLQSAQGCDSVLTTTLTIATPFSLNVAVSGSTISAIFGGGTYQWIDCGNGNAIIPAATSQSYTPAVSGSYAVIISSGGCTDTTACLGFTVGMDETIFGNDFSIFPNPAIDKIEIYFGAPISDLTIEIRELTGKTVISSNASHTNSINLDVTKLANGIYFVKISDGKREKVLRMLKE